ncbi:hypothetical protein [Micromonospora sp. IBSANI012]|uniref:hypothetical protein n=1 Tax=Micromonospora sp. IBSANI012 TaxID=3457761 RepID=UPI0040588939
MTGQRRVFTLLGLAGLGVALLAWGIGVKSTNDLVGLVGACISAAVGVLSLVEAARRGPGADSSRAGDVVAGDAAGRIGGPATDGRSAGPGADGGPATGGPVDGPESGGEGTGRTGGPGAPSGPARRRPSRRLLAAGIAVLLLVVAGTTLAYAITDRRSEADATSPSATTPAATSPAATTPASADPSTTGKPDPPTSAAPTPGPTGPDWVPPPDAPRWTLRGEDAVSFVPALRLDRGTGAGTLIFQARLEQLAWYHWTDDPKDLTTPAAAIPGRPGRTAST